ncbi:TPA: HAD family hydrolase, partial [Enterococcus faecium]
MDEMKLIGIDLDGTLLNSDQSISQKNARTMKHLPEDCFPFICSGREVEDINNILK